MEQGLALGCTHDRAGAPACVRHSPGTGSPAAHGAVEPRGGL